MRRARQRSVRRAYAVRPEPSRRTNVGDGSVPEARRGRDRRTHDTRSAAAQWGAASGIPTGHGGRLAGRRPAPTASSAPHCCAPRRNGPRPMTGALGVAVLVLCILACAWVSVEAFKGILRLGGAFKGSRWVQPWPRLFIPAHEYRLHETRGVLLCRQGTIYRCRCGRLSFGTKSAAGHRRRNRGRCEADDDAGQGEPGPDRPG